MWGYTRWICLDTVKWTYDPSKEDLFHPCWFLDTVGSEMIISCFTSRSRFFHLGWKRHHYRWRAAKFDLHVYARDLYCATPTVTRASVYPVSTRFDSCSGGFRGGPLFFVQKLPFNVSKTCDLRPKIPYFFCYFRGAPFFGVPSPLFEITFDKSRLTCHSNDLYNSSITDASDNTNVLLNIDLDENYFFVGTGGTRCIKITEFYRALALKR
jgi:hypothetical protein